MSDIMPRFISAKADKSPAFHQESSVRYFSTSGSDPSLSITELAYGQGGIILTVAGSFGSWEGLIEADGDDFEDAKATFTADIDSIRTNNEDHD